MDAGELALRGTIWAALVAWPLAEQLRGRARPREARLAWTVAAVSTIVHSALAFAVRYDWSHGAAYSDTARQTAAVTGWAWGGGVLVNYAFLALWAAHAAWWWTAGPSGPPRAFDRAMRGLALFMFLNGAIVFAHGPVRVAGALAVLAVLHAWYLRAGAERTATA